MTRFLADENFNHRILTGLSRRIPDFDFTTVQDAGLEGVDDPALLDWAATEGMVALSHDANTLAGFAYDRVMAGLPMPGLVIVKVSAPTSVVIDDLVLTILCSEDSEWNNRVLHVPL